MKRGRSLITFTVVLLVGLAACDKNDDIDTPHLDCTDASKPTGSMSAVDARIPVAGPLTIQGTVRPPTGLTIQRVLVGNTRAKNIGFDFDSWTATVSAGQLAQLATTQDMSGSSNRLKLTASAYDACSRWTEVGMLDIELSPVLIARSDDLALEVHAPSGNSIPANGAVPARIEVRGGAASAVGLVVTLETTLGEIEGESTVTLVARGGNGASATALLTSTVAGTAFISAFAGAAHATGTIQVAAPPEIAPGVAALAPSQKLRLEVRTAAELASCQASPANRIAVTAGTADLMATPSKMAIENGVAFIDVETSAALSATATTVVSCTDVYGQSGTAQITAAP